jgi:hypothetical protein
VSIKKCYKWQQGNEVTFDVETNFFRFVKFDSRNNNIYIKIKKSLLRNDGEAAETSFTFSVPIGLPSNIHT